MIDLVDVSKSYGPGLPAVNHANLHVDKGEFVFVVGSSGSGKSTLIKLLMKELDSTRRNDHSQRRTSGEDETQTCSEISQKTWRSVPGFPSSERPQCI